MLSVENDAHQTSHKRYFLRTVEIKDYNVMIDGQNFFDQPVNNNIKTYEIFKKTISLIATSVTRSFYISKLWQTGWQITTSLS